MAGTLIIPAWSSLVIEAGGELIIVGDADVRIDGGLIVFDKITGDGRSSGRIIQNGGTVICNGCEVYGEYEIETGTLTIENYLIVYGQIVIGDAHVEVAGDLQIDVIYSDGNIQNVGSVTQNSGTVNATRVQTCGKYTINAGELDFRTSI